jgi:hypothetical protein
MMMTLRDKSAPPVYANTVGCLTYLALPAAGAAIAAVAAGTIAGTGAGHGLAAAGKTKPAKALFHFATTCGAGRHRFGETAQPFKLVSAL